MNKLFIVFFLTFLSLNLFSQGVQLQNTSTIPANSLQNFSNNSEQVKKLIVFSLHLAEQNIGYLYGSADPKNKGMDCSGTIFYVLTQMGLKEVPRSSDLIYQWVLESGHFYPVNTITLPSPQFSNLHPGDLLFWSGTYSIGNRANNITHVMIYLGTIKDGKPLMFGSSDGRSFQGKKVFGVSVFDFYLPNRLSKSKFLGYSCIPGFSCNK